MILPIFKSFVCRMATNRDNVDKVVRTSDDLLIRSPCRLVIFGSSGSGKSTLVLDLIEKSGEIFSHPIDGGVFYLQSQHQPIYDDFKESHKDVDITFSDDVKAADEFVDSDNTKHKILVIDDFIGQMSSRDFAAFVNNLFLGRGRHTNTNIIFISQSIFSKDLRIVRINANHLILFPFVQDKRSLMSLASQILPNRQKFFFDSLTDAAEGRYGYLHINFDVSNLEPELSNSIYPRTGTKYYKEF